VTAHASARAAPRTRRHALPNDVSSDSHGYICSDERHDHGAAFRLRRPTQLSRHGFVSRALFGSRVRATEVISVKAYPGFDLVDKPRGSARNDRTHHAPLDPTEMIGMQTAMGVAMPAQDIGTLDGGSVRADVGAGHNPHPGRVVMPVASPPATGGRAGSASPGSYRWRPACSAPSTTDYCARAATRHNALLLCH
jgi:hypothetical protein